VPPKPKLEAMLIVPDSHRPYHDVRAWGLMLKVGRELEPKHLVVMGDLADFYTVSSHSKDPSRVRQLEDELTDVNVGLDELDALGAKHKKFVAGNHEDRLTRYLSDKAPELFTMVGIPQLLNLDKRGWEYTPYKQGTKVGKVHFTHDVGVAGRNSSFKAMDTYHHSVVTAHAHRMQYLVEGDATGDMKLAAQFGWLGDADKVDYMHRVNVNKNWALGFGIGYMNPVTGIGYLTPVPIIRVNDEYTAVVSGKYFSN
jgi:hypothetical protein